MIGCTTEPHPLKARVAPALKGATLHCCAAQWPDQAVLWCLLAPAASACQATSKPTLQHLPKRGLTCDRWQGKPAHL